MRDVTNMPGKKNPGIKAVRPFGGGNTLCPGRFFASNEIMAFVATVMLTFDFEILPGQKMARSATHLPTVGTYAPTHDIKMKLKLRQ
jgi:cytochrome P450